MLIIGLTRGLGAGKSTVSNMLVDRGAVLVDGDAIVREIQRPDGAAFAPIVERFGPGVVAADGTLDRPAVAAIVFNDPAALADLNAITHPLVLQTMAERVAAQAETDNVVILDIPLLAEGGRERWTMDGVIVVDAPVEVAVSRLVEQRGMHEADARARVAAQATREERVAAADFVVDNSGSLDRLREEVERCWSWISSLC